MDDQKFDLVAPEKLGFFDSLIAFPLYASRGDPKFFAPRSTAIYRLQFDVVKEEESSIWLQFKGWNAQRELDAKHRDASENDAEEIEWLQAQFTQLVVRLSLDDGLPLAIKRVAPGQVFESVVVFKNRKIVSRDPSISSARSQAVG